MCGQLSNELVGSKEIRGDLPFSLISQMAFFEQYDIVPYPTEAIASSPVELLSFQDEKEQPMDAQRWKTFFALLILTLFILTSKVYADLSWESEIDNKGVPGEADGVQIGKYYYTLEACRMESGDTVTIMDFQKGTMYVLNTKDKTYQEMIPQEIPEEMDKEEQELMKKMMEGMMESVEINPTNETKRISGYRCTKYNITMMGINNEYWLSKEVEGYDEFKKISEHMAKGFEKNPMLKQMNITGMMNKLHGFPVKTVNRIPGGGTVTTTLKRIERTSLSKDLFEVPRGYTVKQEEDISKPIGPQQMPAKMPEELKKMMEQMMEEAGKSQE